MAGTSKKSIWTRRRKKRIRTRRRKKRTRRRKKRTSRDLGLDWSKPWWTGLEQALGGVERDLGLDWRWNLENCSDN